MHAGTLIISVFTLLNFQINYKYFLLNGKKYKSTELCTAKGKLKVNCSLLVHCFWSRYLLLIYYINNMQLYNFGHSIVQKSLLLLLSLFPILMPVVVCFFWAPDNLITQMNDCCDRWTEAER